MLQWSAIKSRGGVVTSCYGNWDKLQLEIPLDLSTDFIFLLPVNVRVIFQSGFQLLLVVCFIFVLKHSIAMCPKEAIGLTSL